MKPVLIVNPENGWDSVVKVLDGDQMTPEQFDECEDICRKHGMILIDWKRFSDVESFLNEYKE